MTLKEALVEADKINELAMEIISNAGKNGDVVKAYITGKIMGLHANSQEKVPTSESGPVDLSEKKDKEKDQFGFVVGTNGARMNKLLLKKARTKKFLAEKFETNQGVVSQHINRLRKKGFQVVVEKTIGNASFYRLHEPESSEEE